MFLMSAHKKITLANTLQVGQADYHRELSSHQHQALRADLVVPADREALVDQAVLVGLFLADQKAQVGRMDLVDQMDLADLEAQRDRVDQMDLVDQKDPLLELLVDLVVLADLEAQVTLPCACIFFETNPFNACSERFKKMGYKTC